MEIIKKYWKKALIIAILFVAFDFILNYTFYNPSFITPIYGFFRTQNIISGEKGGYDDIKISVINHGTFLGPRARVTGIVTDVVKSADGDYHIDVKDDSGVLVNEIVPEYMLTIPHIGDTIQIWGVVRYDMFHRWWEIHPVFGWKNM